MPRPLVRLPVPPGRAGIDALLEPLREALEGTGPAVALVPTNSATVGTAFISRVLEGMHLQEPLDDDGCAVVISTSGSTAAPAGVMLSAGNLTALTEAVHAGIDRPQWVLALPATGAGGLNVVVRALQTDSPLLVLPSIGGAAPFGPAPFADAVNAAEPGRGVIASLVPAQLRRLLADDEGLRALRACTRILLGGEAAPGSLLAAARSLGIDVVTTYGCTETAGGCVFDGVPAPGVGIAIDGGRITVSGPTVAIGYRGGARFAGEFATEDLGEFADGRLRVLGRVDDVVQVDGVNVSLSAVDRVLADLPDIAEVCTVPGPPVTSFLVVRDGAPLDEAAIRAAVQGALGPAARPRCVGLGALPRLPNGKPDRAALATMAAG